MSSNLITYRAAIASTLAADSRLSGVNIYTHGGLFDLSEINAYARKAPAVVISLAKIEAENLGGQAFGNIAVSLVVFTADRGGVTRDVRAIQIVEALMNILRRTPNQTWGLGGTFALRVPSDVTAQNLYNRKADNEGVGIWALVFHQLIEMSTGGIESGDDFLTFGAKWDLSPRSGDAPLGSPTDPQPDDAVIDAEDLVDPNA